jgi:hypothetical protein
MSRTSSARSRAGLLTAAAAAVAAATMLASTATAHAACYGSTPSAAAYADPIDGEFGLPPEITTVRAGVDGACVMSVDPGIALPLDNGDAVLVYIDADGNPSTGAVPVGGADVVIGTLGLTGPDSPPMRGVWTGTAFAFTDPGPIATGLGNGGFSARVDALGITPGVTAHLLVASMYEDYDDAYLDLAPGSGTIALPVAYSTVAPAAPAPVVTSVQPRKAAARTSCTVPRTKGLTESRARARLRSSGCEVFSVPTRAYSATVRRGRVVGTTVPAGRSVTAPFRLVVSKGKRPRRAKAAAAPSVLDRLNELVLAR